ncbi:MAG: MATE family efflux transporter [Spirochaetales bacterium]|nr:MATE family efflux transporter [Spirochaetales bacterium]
MIQHMLQSNLKKYEIDMLNGPILSRMLRFTVPLMCSSILQILFNAADIVVVGRFAGPTALAAVGSNSALINLVTNLFIGLSIGANVVVARYFGAKDDANISESVHTSIMLGIVSGIILTVAGLIGARFFLRLMLSPEDVLPKATIYLRIYFLGMVPMMVYNFGSAILRAVGDTKRPLYYLLFAGVLNVILNLLFVLVFRLEVAGVALATIISQTVSALLIVSCLCKEKGCIKLNFKKLKIEGHKFRQIVKVGLPAGFQGCIFALSNTVIQSSVNSFGSIVMAGNAAASNVEGIVYFAMNAFYQAAISFSSQNAGAGNYKRIKRIVLTAQGCVIVAGAAAGFLLLYFGPSVMRLFSADADVIKAGMVRLSIILSTYFLCGMMDVMVGGLRGIGYSVTPMVVSLIGACGLRLVWISTVFQIPKFHMPATVYLSYPASWLVTFCVHVICFVIFYRRVLRQHEQGASQESAGSK